MQFYPLSFYLIPLRPKYYQQPILKHPQSTFLNVSDQVSHPYKRTGKIIVLYILIFVFLDSKLQDTMLHRMILIAHTVLSSVLSRKL